MNKIVYHDKKDFLEYREGMDGTVEIFDIAVGTKRGKGIGTKLINELKEMNYRLIYAFVRGSNLGARKFYKKNGFKEVRLPRFYSDEDAVIVSYETI